MVQMTEKDINDLIMTELVSVKLLDSDGNLVKQVDYNQVLNDWAKSYSPEYTTIMEMKGVFHNDARGNTISD